MWWHGNLGWGSWLAQRFARGEIYEDEYRRRLDALGAIGGAEVRGEVRR